MEQAAPYAKPVPVPTALSKPFWEGLREGRVLVQYSPSQDQWVFYPRSLAPGTLADDLEWREVSGRATLYTFSVAYRPTAPPWADSLPQILAVVELAEGPRLTSELVGVEPADIRIGMALVPAFEDIPGTEMTLLRFAPQ